MPNILSACKAEEGGDAVASLTDDNAAYGKIGGAGSLIIGRMEHWLKYIKKLVLQINI